MRRIIILALAILVVITGCAQMQNHYETQGSTDDQYESIITEVGVTEIIDVEETIPSDVDNSATDDEDVTQGVALETSSGTTTELPDINDDNPASVKPTIQEPTVTTTEEKSETPATVEEAPSEEPVTEQTTEPEVTTQQTEPANASVSYSPDRVVSLAISKCIAGGMILTTENLNMLLANGSITEEEYNSYYPYDGLGYYSVFVETDLNKAATTSGRLLGSEEGIADYIAGMLLLEREPYFMIEYAGTTECGGQTFYEFRCYR